MTLSYYIFALIVQLKSSYGDFHDLFLFENFQELLPEPW